MPCRCIRRTLVLAALAALLSPVRATVWYANKAAPGPAHDGTTWAAAFPSVQPALEAALPGDEVWVAAGTYLERILVDRAVGLYGGFAGTETARSQRDPRKNATVLDGGWMGSVVRITADATVDGFTITRGSGTLRDHNPWGGGIYITDASPTISNNLITENASTAVNPSTATYAGGIGCVGGAPVIIHNVFTHNTASEWGGGAALIQTTGGMVADNVFWRNEARYGAAVMASSGPIVNNTIVQNAGYDAVSCRTNVVANNLIAYNGGGVRGALALHHNLLYGNLSGDRIDVPGPPPLDTVNVYANPGLVDSMNGDLHLRQDSPARNTGSGADAVGAVDMDGQPRVQEDAVDIGADEWDGTVYPAPVRPVLRVHAAGNDANDGRSWLAAKKTVQTAVDSLLGGGEVWVATDTAGPVTLQAGVSMYGGFAGTETEREQRDPSAHPTGVKGIEIPSGAADTVVDGFVVSGAIPGIRADARNVTIAHNVVQDNSATVDSSWGSYPWNLFQLGAGISCRGASGVIEDNVIRHNQVSYVTNAGSGVMGGGIGCENSALTIRRNVITDNYVSAGHYWWGEMSSAFGGGIFGRNSRLVIEDNLLAGNSAGAQTSAGGGGIACIGGSAVITNNTIAGNVVWLPAGAPDPRGGGLYLTGDASAFTVTNNIVASNTSGAHTDAAWTFRHNLVYGNEGLDYEQTPDLTGRDGNISADPLFAGRDAGNYRLASGSPAIDAGDSAAVRSLTDLEGRPRILGAAVDMGAYESGVPAAYTAADARRALALAAGMEAATVPDRIRLDVEGSGSIDIRDALRVARRVFGRDSNP